MRLTAWNHRFYYISLIFVILILSNGCSNQTGVQTPQSSTKQHSSSNSATKTTLYVNYGDSTRSYYGNRLSYYEKVKEIMENKHSDVEIKWSTSLDADILTLGTWQYGFDYSNALDLKPFFQKDKIDMNDLYPQLINMYTIDGKLVGLPGYPQPLVVFYNKKWFDQAKIPYPDGNWTTDEFKTTLIKLKAANLTNPDDPVLYLSPNVDIEPLVMSNGGNFMSPDGSQLKGYLDVPKTMEAIEWITGLYREKLATFNEASAYPTRGAGKLGMAIAWYSMEADLRQLPSDHNWYADNIGMTLLPYFKGGEHVTTTSTYISIIPKSSKNPELAWEFLREMFIANNELSVMRAKTDLLITKSSVSAAKQDQDPIRGPLIKDYSQIRQSAMFRNEKWFRTAMNIGREIRRLGETQDPVAEALRKFAEDTK